MTDLKANGHINIPNVNSTNECIGLTYTIRNVEDLKQIKNIQQRLDEVTKVESFVNFEVSKYGTDEEAIVMKYKVKACGSDKKARSLKATCDQLLQKLGGQTVLDPTPTTEEE